MANIIMEQCLVDIVADFTGPGVNNFGAFIWTIFFHWISSVKHSQIAIHDFIVP